LLDGANFLFVPIFNVDGHERRSPYTRSNQRGPEITGWRTNSRNINLNRDYAKLDTPEMRAMVTALNNWDPDLYYDIHVTDGADYQYDITFGCNDVQGYSPAIAATLNALHAQLDKGLEDAGHVPGQLVFELDGADFSKGLRQMTAEPRYSHGYGDVRHVPTFLVENHALKPYDQRVLGTYVLLRETLKQLGANFGHDLRTAIEQDRQPRTSIPLAFGDKIGTPELIDFKGIEYRIVPSEISGHTRTEWLGKPKLYHFPFVKTSRVLAQVDRPAAYLIPPAWSEVIERLKLHGIKVQTLHTATTLDVAMYRLDDAKLMSEPFEGHVGIASCTTTVERRHETFVAGTVRVPTDQPLGDLAVILLEPQSPDSFLRWGFFNEILQRTEYIDGYILEPMAEKMLKDDPALAEAFAKKLADDKDFAASPSKRLDWFYSKTPFADDRWKLYPVARQE
jgi:Zinc carboxypeptidase